jgi:hypothetical protein
MVANLTIAEISDACHTAVQHGAPAAIISAVAGDS